MTDEANGEGRTGLDGLFSWLKDRIKETLSLGLGAALAIWWCARARKGEGDPGERDRLILRRIECRGTMTLIYLFQYSGIFAPNSLSCALQATRLELPRPAGPHLVA